MVDVDTMRSGLRTFRQRTCYPCKELTAQHDLAI